MKNGPMTALAVFLVLLNFGHTVKLAFQVINGSLLLGKARKSGRLIVKGSNAAYKAVNYIVAVAFEIFSVVVMCRIFFMSGLSAVLFVFTAAIIASLFVDTVIHTIALFAEKNVYLTESGLIYFLGSFKFSDSRFSWDSSDNPDSLSDKLYIYKGKDKYPFVASFEDRETAHRIVAENSVKQQ